MKQIWEDDFNNLYRDVEDMQNHCKYLESENNQLQSNWNSLREWLEEQKKSAKKCKEWNNKKGFFDIDYDRDIKMFEFILDKMNELEGNDKN